MIISRSRGFVFTTMPKVGSTTLNAILYQFADGENDTGSGWEDDPIDAVVHKTHPGKNFPQLTFNELLAILQRPIPFWPGDVNGDLSKLNNNMLQKWVNKIGNQEFTLNMIAASLVRHLTPTELVNAKMITEQELYDFEWYTVIREPFDRFLSAHFYDVSIHNTDNTVQGLIDHIDSIDPATGYMLYMMKNTRDWTEYNGETISNVIKYENFKSDIQKFIHKYNGEYPDELPRYKGYSRPEWSKQPVEEFLPQSSIDKLKLILKDDIEHYSEL